jgi:hypothetical protein
MISQLNNKQNIRIYVNTYKSMLIMKLYNDYDLNGFNLKKLIYDINNSIKNLHENFFHLEIKPSNILKKDGNYLILVIF